MKKEITDHNHDEYRTAPEFKKKKNLSEEVFDERLKQANLVTMTDFDDKLESQSDSNGIWTHNHLVR